MLQTGINGLKPQAASELRPDARSQQLRTVSHGPKSGPFPLPWTLPRYSILVMSERSVTLRARDMHLLARLPCYQPAPGSTCPEVLVLLLLITCPLYPGRCVQRCGPALPAAAAVLPSWLQALQHPRQLRLGALHAVRYSRRRLAGRGPTWGARSLCIVQRHIVGSTYLRYIRLVRSRFRPPA